MFLWSSHLNERFALKVFCNRMFLDEFTFWIASYCQAVLLDNNSDYVSHQKDEMIGIWAAWPFDSARVFAVFISCVCACNFFLPACFVIASYHPPCPSQPATQCSVTPGADLRSPIPVPLQQALKITHFILKSAIFKPRRVPHRHVCTCLSILLLFQMTTHKYKPSVVVRYSEVSPSVLLFYS